MNETVLAAVALGLFGLVFGSFGNVVIWRVPRGESIVSPPSHCPRCGHDVRWYDNIPVVSWLLLRGRCRDCAEPISPRYPVVELLSGALWALAGWRWGLTGTAIAGSFFFYVLMLLAIIDVDTGRLPNVMVGILAGAGVLGAGISQVTGVAVSPLLGQATSGWLAQPLAVAFAGAAAGALVSLAIAGIYSALRGRAGLGMGDVKLLGGMGLFLGPWVLLAYLIGNVLGAVWGLVLAARARGEGVGGIEVRFGPFLAAGAVLTAVAGPALVAGYFDLIAWLAARMGS